MKKILILLFLTAFSITHFAACNTMQGMGKDIKKAGEAIEDVAK